MITKKIKFNNKGITLIETVLYLAIVAILFTALISFHLTLGGTAIKVSSNSDVSRNRRTALNTIDYLIKNADGALKDLDGECSDFVSTPQSLFLYFEDDTYLPGTCVEGGGGVKVSLDNRQVKLTCYPNIPYNGWYKACDAMTYVSGNAYYLTEPSVVVYNDNLSFSTSTASSTANNFLNVTTNIVVNTLSGGQLDVAATSTATSTVTLRNEQMSGLVAWYKFSDGEDEMVAVDSIGGLDLACDDAGVPTLVTPGLVSGSDAAYDFEYSETDYCSLASPDELAFGDAFSLTAWIKAESLSTEHRIINNGSWTNYKGYQFYVASNGGLWCRVFDGTNYSYAYTPASTIATDGSIYHVSCVYDKDDDLFNVYSFKKGVVGVTTGTPPSTIYALVNNNENVNLGYADNFDGVLDDVRFYNRALSVEEIWALQSQGL